MEERSECHDMTNEFCQISYERAQLALVDIKVSILTLLEQSGDKGLRNVDIGRALGTYHGHEGHEGHISRSIFSLMEAEGVVEPF